MAEASWRLEILRAFLTHSAEHFHADLRAGWGQIAEHSIGGGALGCHLQFATHQFTQSERGLMALDGEVADLSLLWGPTFEVAHVPPPNRASAFGPGEFPKTQ